MIRLPSDSKDYAVSNASDLKGNIWYTKNINLDEEGYIKLSSRSIGILSEQDDADAELPLAFGRGGSIDGTLTFNIVTNDKAFTADISESALTLTQDTNSPAFGLDSHGRWYRNLWTVSETNDFYTLSGTTYTDRGNLTSGKAHPIEVFRNRDTICIGDGNTVLQFDNAYSASTTLTLPTDFEVVKLAYANNRMGVLTALSDTASGQNQESYFFVWDGATTSAEQGVPIGSDRGIDVIAYLGSFVVLTRTGQLLYYTGGGFKPLASFPFYYDNKVWGTSYARDTYGDIMSVEGDVIYINFNGLLNSSGERYEKYSQNSPGGVWCYDPRVGLYHRYSPSVSMANMLTVTSGNVNTTTDVLTATVGTIPQTGAQIKYMSDKTALIGGLKTPLTYYCIRQSATEFSLATTYQNAIDGEKIDLTSTGAANNYFLALDTVDYGQSYIQNSGATAFVGGVKQIYDHLIYGAEMADTDSTATYNYTCITSPGFESRGYVVTPRIVSSNIQDIFQKLFASYRPLKENDKIVYKVKDREYAGLPVSTTQARSSDVNKCVWTSPDGFYTTTDISSALTAYTAGIELECEIIGGAGSGTLVKIASITEDAGTYAVTLAEDVIGAGSGKYSDVLIDNWKVVGEITNDTNKNWHEIPTTSKSDWFKVKVEMRGSEVAIFDQKFINSVLKAAA